MKNYGKIIVEKYKIYKSSQEHKATVNYLQNFTLKFDLSSIQMIQRLEITRMAGYTNIKGFLPVLFHCAT
ncbi:MAG: hypothetical protein AAF757_15880 [Cyanobacteria bacterium P01_D01_bin.116]